MKKKDLFEITIQGRNTKWAPKEKDQRKGALVMKNGDCEEEATRRRTPRIEESFKMTSSVDLFSFGSHLFCLTRHI